MIRLLVLTLLVLFSTTTASYADAEKEKTPPVKKHITYFSDPEFAPTYEGATHSLAHLQGLAEKGDKRAQFILGDLYAKGKGGFPKDLETARLWFEKSGRQHYAHSFVRLAALEKREEKSVEAYKWYILGLRPAKKESKQLYTYIKGKMEQLKTNAALDRDDLRTAEKLAKNWKKQKNTNAAYQRGAYDFN